jgi:hypothetical protein
MGTVIRISNLKNKTKQQPNRYAGQTYSYRESQDREQERKIRQILSMHRQEFSEKRTPLARKAVLLATNRRQ